MKSFIIKVVVCSSSVESVMELLDIGTVGGCWPIELVDLPVVAAADAILNLAEVMRRHEFRYWRGGETPAAV